MRRRAQRGLTLLELLIAMTILASITGGIGLFWSQARAWEEDNRAHRDVLRVERVLSLLREQWGAKRALVTEGAGDAGGSGVSFGAEGVTFVTARPVLFPGWGLVNVRYAVERAIDGTYTLVYEESRVLDPTELPEAGAYGVDPRGRPIGDRVVLLEGLDALRVERWGTTDGRVRGALDGIVDDEDEEGLGVNTDDLAERWRPFDRELEGAVRAVRFVGSVGEEVFSCVLVDGRLR